MHSQVKAESGSPIAILIIKATSKLQLKKILNIRYFARFVEEASESKKSNEE